MGPVGQLPGTSRSYLYSRACEGAWQNTYCRCAIRGWIKRVNQSILSVRERSFDLLHKNGRRCPLFAGPVRGCPPWRGVSRAGEIHLLVSACGQQRDLLLAFEISQRDKDRRECFRILGMCSWLA